MKVSIRNVQYFKTWEKECLNQKSHNIINQLYSKRLGEVVEWSPGWESGSLGSVQHIFSIWYMPQQGVFDQEGRERIFNKCCGEKW